MYGWKLLVHQVDVTLSELQKVLKFLMANVTFLLIYCTHFFINKVYYQ